jgi:hypothetical protein
VRPAYVWPREKPVTDKEWLTCGSPQVMLEWLQGKVSNRKWRLFACAAARMVWTSLPPPAVRRAVETGEQFADGHTTESELWWAHSQAYEAAHAAVRQGDRRQFGHRLRRSERRLFFAAGAAHPRSPVPISHLLHVQADDELAMISPLLLRDIFGPLPFRPVTIAPDLLQWREGLLVRLADAAYGQRSLPDGLLELARLAVLPDALEEAGCGDQEVLAHLREPGRVHVRGCWPVDLLLGKS